MRAWVRGVVATATTPAVVKLATKMEESSVNAVSDGMLPLSLPTALVILTKEIEECADAVGSAFLLVSEHGEAHAGD